MEQTEIDVSTIIEAIMFKNSNEVWKEYVEAEKISEARIYWRKCFFEAVNTMFPACIFPTPKGKEFVNMVIEFNGLN